MQPKQFYFEAHVRPERDASRVWQRQDGVFANYLEAQAAAMKLGLYPYRIKDEPKPLVQEDVGAA